MSRSLSYLAAAIAFSLASPAIAAGGASERAQALIGSHPALVHAGSADRFHARDVIIDADGSEHVRLDRSHGGLPVIGGDVVVHSRGGLPASASLTLSAPLRLSLRPALAADEAVVAAGAEFGSDFHGRPTAVLSV